MQILDRPAPTVTCAPRASYRLRSAARPHLAGAPAPILSVVATGGELRPLSGRRTSAAWGLAAEGRGPGGGAPGRDPDRIAAPDHSDWPISNLTRAVDDVLALDVDALGVPEVEQALRAVQPQIDRLYAHRSRLTATLAERAAAVRGARGGGNDERARDQGDREARDFLRNDLNLTPGEAKGALQSGRATRDGSATGDAYTNGELRPEQVSIITGLLEGLTPELRDRLEEELLVAARELDAVALGRLGRRRVLELAPANATEREDAQHRRRAFRLGQTADGAVVPSGRLYGAQAEAALAAWHAFRRPDAKGEQRSPDQRGADAFEQLCAVAMRSGDAPTRHGERPQLLVVADQGAIADDEGFVELGFTGPTSLRSVRLLLSDCVLSRIGLDGEGVATEVTRKVRTVPAGLWRSLVARDRGCTWVGCDAPAGWCDVSHGDQAYTDGGRLTPNGAALLCRRHHRLFDHGSYRRRVVDGVVRYERVGDGPKAGDRPGRASRAGSNRKAAGGKPMAAAGRSGKGQGRGDPSNAPDGSPRPARPAGQPDPGAIQGQLGMDLERSPSSDDGPDPLRSGDQRPIGRGGERAPP